MATQFYEKAAEGFMSGDFDLAADDLRVILIDNSDYTVDLINDEFLEDIPAAARVATSGALASKSIARGIFSAAATLVFSSVTGDPIDALVIYKHTGSEATAALVAHIDNPNQFPLTPDGTDITLTWDPGDNKIVAFVPA